MKILLGGEGPNELGRWANHPPNPDPTYLGVVEGLLRRVRTDGWSVAEGVLWKDIRKYKAGAHRDKETRNVLGLVLKAKEMGCDAVAFVRDRDGTNANPNHERQQAVEDGILEAGQLLADCPKIIGGMAVKKLESWLLALRGEAGSESVRRPEEKLKKAGIELKSTSEYFALVQAADLDALPADATSLRLWLERAGSVLEPGD